MAITQVRIARSPLTGTLFCAYCDGGLYVQRFDDADPPTVADTITVVSWSSSLRVVYFDLSIQLDGSLQLVYTQYVHPSNWHWEVRFKTSVDQGSTWSTHTVVCNSWIDLLGDSGDYQQPGGVTHAVDERRGLFVILVRLDNFWDGSLLWRKAWSIVFGSLTGSAWTFTSPSIIYDVYGLSVLPRKECTDVIVLPDGAWDWAIWYLRPEYGYVAPSAKDRSLRPPSDFTEFSDRPDESTTPLGLSSHIVHRFEKSIKVFVWWHPTNHNWVLQAGQMDNATPPQISLSAASEIVAASGCIDAGGSLLYSGDGVYEFAYANASSGITILRCRALSSSGVGVWA